MTPPSPDESRLNAIERQLAALTAELSAVRAELALRHTSGRTEVGSIPRRPSAAASTAPRLPTHLPPSPARRLDPRDIEGLLGRYGMLAIAVVAAVAAVGTFLSWAITHGYLTLGPAARVFVGLACAVGVAFWGLRIRRTERSFGSSMLGLALVIALVCAYAAGPSLHLVPIGVAFVGAALASVTLATFAHASGDEPLWCVAFGGAALAPFVTSDGRANVYTIAIYACIVLLPACLAISHRDWPIGWRVFYLVSAMFVLAAASEAHAAGLPGYVAAFVLPFVIAGAGVVPFAPSTRKRGALRWLAFLGVIASLAASGDQAGMRIFAAVLMATMCLWLVIVDRNADEPQSSILARGRELPALLDGVDMAVIPLFLVAQATNLVYSPIDRAVEYAVSLAVFALFAWRRKVSPLRDAAAFASVVAGIGAVRFLPLEEPTGKIGAFLVLGLASLAMHKLRPSRSWLAMGGAMLLAAAALSGTALADRAPYQFTAFATEPSAAALLVMLALALVARFWPWMREATRASIADRAEWTYAGSLRQLLRVVTAAPWCWAFIWVMIELSMTYSPSASTLLLVTYFAATAVLCVGAGQARHSARLRQTGLALALVAAGTACFGATSYFDPAARIAAYLVTSAFLLGIAYWYRRPGAATP